MDFKQDKLTKSEWESIEIPVLNSEKQIIKMIIDGFENVNISFNNNVSLLGFMKIIANDDDDLIKMYTYTYNTYFKKNVETQLKKYFKENEYKHPKEEKSTLRKIDKMRMEQTPLSSMDDTQKEAIFEFMILGLSSKMLKYISADNKRYMLLYYSLSHIINYEIFNVNIHIINYINYLLEHFKNKVNKLKLVSSSANYIEKNNLLLQYDSTKLYDHQKKLFTIFKKNKLIVKKKKKVNEQETIFNNGKEKMNANLVLYIAPTATGKTLSPIGLSEGYRVIYVCAARHVGLALAKSAISIGKKIAFAFGCTCAEDVRLHYFAGSEYVKKDDGKFIKYRDGNQKIDNSVGDKVEIMICDIQSYEYAMYYMLQFNPNPQDIIMFWDEPTITLDYTEHDNHKHIQNTWSKNLIPNIVLSSATLPKEHEIGDVICDFRQKFLDFENIDNCNIQVHSIVSHDCKKTIPLLNSKGYACLPHHITENYEDFRTSIDYCKNNMTILRYFDLSEIDEFIKYLHKNNLIINENYLADNYFDNILDINMKSVKLYYIDLCNQITQELFVQIKNHFQNIENRQSYFNDNYSQDINEQQKGTLITTNDAYTLTDGPTIYMTNNPANIGKYCLKNLNIPTSIIDSITKNIDYNNTILKKISTYEKKLEEFIEKETSSGDNGKTKVNEKKIERAEKMDPEVKKLKKDIDSLLSMIKSISVEEQWIPNTKKHCDTWIDDNIYKHIINGTSKPYSCKIHEEDVLRILEIPQIPNLWRILLAIGIGVFDNSLNQQYMELMKEFADSQKLYLIIANDDYIYGTNYQFCHGFIGKDLTGISQEKTIQALGRVGRNNLQKNYSVRFRNQDLIKNIFFPQDNKPEVINMNNLFVSEFE